MILDQVFFSDNWIENVASLRTDLGNKDIRDLYNVYNSLYTIQKYLDSEDERLGEYIEKISKELFLDFIPISLMMNFREHEIEELLNVERYLLMHKLYKLTYSKAEIVEYKDEVAILSVNHYKIISGDINNGEVVLYNTNGYEKLRGFIVEGEFSTGIYTGYFGIRQQYRIEYQRTSDKRLIIKGILKNYFLNPLTEPLIDAEYHEGNPFNGKYINIHENGSVRYWGQLVNGKRNGYGKLYDEKGNIIFEGEYENNRKINGKLYAKGVLMFDGELFNEKPWTGKAFKVNIDNCYVKKFTGEILEGTPLVGEGLVFKKSKHASSLNELKAIEEMDEEWHYQYEEQMNSEEYQEEQDRWHNENIRTKYGEWEDYIYAEWENSEYSIREEKESNIVVYYNPKSEIK